MKFKNVKPRKIIAKFAVIRTNIFHATYSFVDIPGALPLPGYSQPARGPGNGDNRGSRRRVSESLLERYRSLAAGVGYRHRRSGFRYRRIARRVRSLVLDRRTIDSSPPGGSFRGQSRFALFIQSRMPVVRGASRAGGACGGETVPRLSTAELDAVGTSGKRRFWPRTPASTGWKSRPATALGGSSCVL